MKRLYPARSRLVRGRVSRSVSGHCWKRTQGGFCSECVASAEWPLLCRHRSDAPQYHRDLYTSFRVCLFVTLTVCLLPRSSSRITIPPTSLWLSSSGASVRHPSPPLWRIKTPGLPSSTTTNANPRNAVRSARKAARWFVWVREHDAQLSPRKHVNTPALELIMCF